MCDMCRSVHKGTSGILNGVLRSSAACLCSERICNAISSNGHTEAHCTVSFFFSQEMGVQCPIARILEHL
jgi:hypothetical protein